MKSVTYAEIALILFGTAVFALSITSGEGGVALFLIFPVFYSTGALGALGILLIFIGFLLLFLSPFLGATAIEEERRIAPPDFEQDGEKKREVRYGGVVFIGPIPIVFGSDKNYLLYAMLGGFLLLFALIIFLLIL